MNEGRRLAEQRGEELAAMGARSYEAWLAQKAAAKAREQRNLRLFLDRQRMEAEQRAAEKEAERLWMKERERGWPSRIVLPQLKPPLHIPPLDISSPRRSGSPLGSPQSQTSGGLRPMSTAERYGISPGSVPRNGWSARPGPRGSPMRATYSPPWATATHPAPPRTRPGTVPATTSHGRSPRTAMAMRNMQDKESGLASPRLLPTPPTNGASWAYQAFAEPSPEPMPMSPHPPKSLDDEVTMPDEYKTVLVPEEQRPKGPRRRDFESPPSKPVPAKANAPPEVLASLAALEGARPGTSYQHARSTGEYEEPPSAQDGAGSRAPNEAMVENFGDLETEVEPKAGAEPMLGVPSVAASEFGEDFNIADDQEQSEEGEEKAWEGEGGEPNTLFIEG